MNDLVDRLAVEAALDPGGPHRGGEPDATSARPTTAGRGGRPRRRRRDRRLPDGPPACWWPGTGPAELGGYDANPMADGVRDRLGEMLAAKAEVRRRR